MNYSSKEVTNSIFGMNDYKVPDYVFFAGINLEKDIAGLASDKGINGDESYVVPERLKQLKQTDYQKMFEVLDIQLKFFEEEHLKNGGNIGYTREKIISSGNRGNYQLIENAVNQVINQAYNNNNLKLDGSDLYQLARLNGITQLLNQREKAPLMIE